MLTVRPVFLGEGVSLADVTCRHDRGRGQVEPATDRMLVLVRRGCFARSANGRVNVLDPTTACFVNPGDVTLMTVPGYPVAGTHTKYYGGSVYRLPLLAENGLVIADNVLWSGRVVEEDGDESTLAIKDFNEHVRNDPRVASVMLTVRDGMTLIRKRD